MEPGESKSLRVAYNFHGASAVGDAAAAARGFAQAIRLDPAGTARLAIVVEELVANIFEHSGIDAGRPVEMVLWHLGREISLVIEDHGSRFDPRDAAPPGDLPPERGGGAGLAIVTAWARVLSYEASGGVNRLELIIPCD